jgi:hypothetical protein
MFMVHADGHIHKIPRLNIIPSAAYGLKRKDIMYYRYVKRVPQHGDVIYGEIGRIGQHQSLESKTGRIHTIYSKDRGIFVVGNRYAPDYYEAIIPSKYSDELDLVSRSGVVSKMKEKNNRKKDPTSINVLGYVCDAEGNIINTTDFPLVVPTLKEKKPRRSKMIVFVGTSMNAGKSFAATSVVKSLTQLGYNVRVSKITGTASLKDILDMSDAGAEKFSDFTFLGHPSTYLLGKEEVFDIFNKLDLKYANKPSNYWVVEIADGIVQRETAMLLSSSEFKKRIHRIVFCAGDALGAVGGVRLLKDKYNITADMVSGVCTASPLHIRELQSFIDTPVLTSAKPDVSAVQKILC